MTGLATPGLTSPFEAGLPPKPYPGLRPFNSEEWPVFFGREPMTDRVIDLVIENKMVVVHGDSGCGKSSLIRAGVLVQLQQGHAATGGRWRTGTMLPREDPLGNLAKAFASVDSGGDQDPTLTAELREFLNGGSYAPETVAMLLRRGKDDHVCILVDQFEELFRYDQHVSHAEAACFVEFLTSLATDPPPGLYAVLTMRSEFLGHCARFQGFAEAVNRTQYLLPRMEHTALMRAIREPARLYGGQVSQQLAERLITDAGGGQDQLPLIQHGLMLLWQRKVVQPNANLESAAEDAGLAEAAGLYRQERSPAWTLDLSDYSASGGLAQLLSDHADQVMREAAPDEARQKIVEHLFRALTDINAEGHAIRRPQTLSQLQAVTGAEPATLDNIMKGFRAEGVSFLNPYGDTPLGPDQQVDVSHEALIRCWRRIADPEDGWLQHEFRDGLVWKTLLVMAGQDATLSAAATADRGRWLKTLPSKAWAERYGNSWDQIKTLLERSHKVAEEREEERRREADERVKRAEEIAAKEEQLRKEQRRRADDAIAAQKRQRRWTMAALGAALIAIVAAVYAWSESQRADQAAGEAQKALREQEIASSKMFAALADAAIERGDTAEALTLALRGLPKTLADIANWPDTPEAGAALIRAARQHEFEKLFLTGHNDSVRSVAFSPDGTRLASGSEDKTVRLWDVASGQETAPLEGHGAAVFSVAFSPDGTRLASGSEDKTVRLWDVASGQETARLEGHDAPVWSVAFSPDGMRLASGSKDGTVRLWHVASAQQVSRLEGHDAEVYSVAFSPDGTRLASGSEDTTVRLWDVASEQQVVRLEGRGAPVRSVAFSPDGTRLASGSYDGTVRLWDLASGEETGRLEGHNGWVRSVAFSPDGMRLASSSDNTARLWDLASREEPARLEGHDAEVYSVAFSPDATRLASGSEDGTVRLWDAASGKEMARLEGHGAPVGSVAFSPDATRLASGSEDGTVRLWDAASGKEMARLEGHGAAVRSVAFSPDGTRLASGSEDGTVRLWDAASGQETARLEGHGAPVGSVAFSPDGTRLASGARDGIVLLWDVASGKETARLEGHGAAVLSVAFSPDGTRLASGSRDRTVRLWDVASGQGKTVRLEGHDAGVRLMAFSPDGTHLASGSGDSTVRLWDVASGQEETARLWDVASGQEETGRSEGHGARVWSVVFSPDGTRLASGAGDNTVRIWRIPHYRFIEELLALTISEAEIDQYARSGQIDLAISAVSWLNRDPRQRPISAETLNSVCWYGALEGYAERVLNTCDAAVAKSPDNGGIRDSRGVALALTGNFEAAMEDFQAFVIWGPEFNRSRAAIQQRREWIDALREGRNPLKPEVLKQLKGPAARPMQ